MEAQANQIETSSHPLVILKGHKHSVSSVAWCPAQHGKNEIVATLVCFLLRSSVSVFD